MKVLVAAIALICILPALAQEPVTLSLLPLWTLCKGPDRVDGLCKSILDCPEFVDKLRQHGSNATFVDFLRKSNAICDNQYAVICCPSVDYTRSDPNDNIPTSLPTMEEGCGSRKQGNFRFKRAETEERSELNDIPDVTERPEEVTRPAISDPDRKHIIGGQNSRMGAWPWIALLGYFDGVSTSPFKCGGALITRMHVLTAAHCIRSDLAYVRLGEHDLNTTLDGLHVDVPVRKVLKHPQFNRKDGRNDIALIYLRKTVEFSNTISPICLATTPQFQALNFVGFSPYVAGWGRTMEGGKTSPILQDLQIPIHNNSVCVDIYRKQNLLMSEDQFDDSVMCAGVLSGGKDTCQGDSGGPLMVPLFNSNYDIRYHMIGIVSYSIGCARPDVLGAYTNVAKFIDWIQEALTDTT